MSSAKDQPRMDHYFKRMTSALDARDAGIPGQDVVAMVVHELRGPLATMSYVLDANGVGPDAATHPSAREILVRQLRKALRLVNDLMDLSQLTRCDTWDACAPIDLSQIITDAVQDIDRQIRDRQQSLTFHEPEERIWVQGDGMRLEQILGNVLENSSKYSGLGGQIVLSLAREENQAVIRVRDNGPGILPEELPRIFEPYFRGNNACKATRNGLGLGLALTRRLVELHGGSIEAKSEGLGRGSEFIIRLPTRGHRPGISSAIAKNTLGG